ncbi:hypothetical protein ACHQM5_007102 [Ranunculus cassubicifolius]
MASHQKLTTLVLSLLLLACITTPSMSQTQGNDPLMLCVANNGSKMFKCLAACLPKGGQLAITCGARCNSEYLQNVKKCPKKTPTTPVKV